MSVIVTGYFSNSKRAGDAVSELKSKGYTKDIFVSSKTHNSNPRIIKGIKKDVSDDAIAAAVACGALGIIVGILGGVIQGSDPGLETIVFGPLTALLGILGGAIGAVVGGFFGAVSSMLVSDVARKLNKERVMSGETQIGVSTNNDTSSEVRHVLTSHGVVKVKESAAI